MSIPRPSAPIAALAVLLAASPQARAIDLGEVGGFELSFEGLFQVDGYRYRDDWSHLGDDTDVRRSELVLKGAHASGFDWVVGYDSKSEKWLDVNARIRFDGRSQHLRVGQFKQPTGLEELSSSTTNDFIAKAAATNTFAVSRRLGVGWGIDQGDWSVSASWFDRELTRNEAEGDGFAARGTWAPLRGEGRVLHLGLSASRRDAPDDGIRLRARPNMDLAGIRLLDTGAIADARRATTVGAEAMWIQGPVKVQAEWFESTVERRDSRDFDGSGGYASVVWQPGGQTWDYREGVPRTPGAGGEPAGLWQLGVRYDRLDLDDPGAGIAGGTMDVWTAGVNWYHGEHLKLALNYVEADTARDTGPPTGWLDVDPSSIQARVQLAW
ncbi:MAG: porin [Gammaproteobacteria bacterium]|nr:porin [Gammaproteobacteria bacterium]